MEQRPLRVGDTVDDYCPRERRVTNHVIVALVEDAIRQTRCGTCDTEHVFKAARLPRKRLKDDEAVDASGQLVARPAADGSPSASIEAAPDVAMASGAPPSHTNVAASPPVGDDPAEPRADDVWPTHRRLIRATLPRVEGENKEPRPIPEFTMHQRQGRGGSPYRGEFFPNGTGNGSGNGRSAGGGGFRQGPPGPKPPGGGGQP